KFTRVLRLEPSRKLALMLLDHLDGILKYCQTKVPVDVVEAVNGNIKSHLRRGRGYKHLRYLLRKVQRMGSLKPPVNSCGKPEKQLKILGPGASSSNRISFFRTAGKKAYNLGPKNENPVY